MYKKTSEWIEDGVYVPSEETEKWMLEEKRKAEERAGEKEPMYIRGFWQLIRTKDGVTLNGEPLDEHEIDDMGSTLPHEWLNEKKEKIDELEEGVPVSLLLYRFGWQRKA